MKHAKSETMTFLLSRFHACLLSIWDFRFYFVMLLYYLMFAEWLNGIICMWFVYDIDQTSVSVIITVLSLLARTMHKTIMPLWGMMAGKYGACQQMNMSLHFTLHLINILQLAWICHFINTFFFYWFNSTIKSSRMEVYLSCICHVYGQ